MMIGSRLKFGAIQGQKAGRGGEVETRNAKQTLISHGRYEQQAALMYSRVILLDLND